MNYSISDALTRMEKMRYGCVRGLHTENGYIVDWGVWEESVLLTQTAVETKKGEGLTKLQRNDAQRKFRQHAMERGECLYDEIKVQHGIPASFKSIVPNNEYEMHSHS